MHRDDILYSLSEPFGTLSNDLKERATTLAKTDTEIAAALALSRMLSETTTNSLVGEPPTSDAVFLTQLREKLDRKTVPLVDRTLSGLRIWFASGFACILLAGLIYLGGVQGGSPLGQDNTLYSEFDLVNPILWTDSDDLAELDAGDVAVALELDEYTDIWSDLYIDGPITDELLELSPDELEEVLTQLEAETFFTTGNSTHES